MEGEHIIVKNVKNNYPLVAICGPIGSGKSTIMAMIKKAGYQIFSFDQLLKKMYQNGGVAYQFVLTKYPQFIVNKTFQPKLVRQKILNDDKFWQNYQQEIWNLLWLEFLKIKPTFPASVFVEIPFFPTPKWIKLFNHIVFVNSSIKNRIKRICKRDNVSVKMAKTFDQIFEKSYFGKEYDIIENNGTIQQLQEIVDQRVKIWKKILVVNKN